MTTIASSTLAPTRATAIPARRPSFFGMVRGEFLKLSRMWLVWASLLVLGGFLFLPLLITLVSPGRIAAYANAPAAAQLHLLYSELGTDAFILRFFSAPVVIILTARLLGMEYSGGTIRLILARGAGRLQFLSVKLLVSAVVALGVALWGVLLTGIFEVLGLLIADHNLNVLKAMNGDYWHAVGTEVLVLVLMLEAMMLMAMTVTIISRSMAFGLSAGLAWFFIDNLAGTIFFIIAYSLTKSNGWLLATGDMLSPNLNAMANLLLPASASGASVKFLSTPITPVTTGHTFLILGIYAAIFLVTSVVLIVRRDVKE